MNLQLQYISQGATIEEHLTNIKRVLDAGCRWVQLRLKGCTSEEVRSAASRASQLCAEAGATFILNDYPTVVHELELDGVHLGKTDLPPDEARVRLGSKIIGGTANSLADCLALIEQKVDYIGLGPLRFTTTKKNLAPVLGVDGYRQIVGALRDAGHQTPVVAIGGIVTDDLQALKETGVNGVAVSGLLSGADVATRTTKIYKVFAL